MKAIKIDWEELEREGRQYQYEPQDREILTGAERKVLAFITAHEGCSFSDLEVTAKNLSAQLRSLMRKGLIRKEKNGKHSSYYTVRNKKK
jgi:DNA-binding MarR family transcriptional regulator